MKKYYAIIIDDSIGAREVLTFMLRAYPEIEIIGVADNIEDGEALILQTLPDIIFLDIQMPGGNGFELAHRLHDQGINTDIIFTTAYRDYTIEAIRSSAFDYLLKPIDSLQLKKAINRFKHNQKLRIQAELSNLTQPLSIPTKIKISNRSGFLLIDIADIMYLEADGTYTDIYLKNGKRVSSSSNLGKLIEMLPEYDFVRISRAFCINLNYLQQVNRLKHLCTLINGENTIELCISRANMKKVEDSLDSRLGNGHKS